MSSLTRQNTLFVAEDWVRIYEALENVDFRPYDFDNLVQAMFQYLRFNYPEQFNDWVASSEFVTKIEILAWLSQNINFRVDLNTRENFLATAERRDSLIRLAQNIGYKMNRVRSANSILKLQTIRTTQEIFDSNGVNLRNKIITWNDPRDEDWFERFILILNSAFVTRTQFGFPLAEYVADGARVEQYTVDSQAPQSGSYRFTSNVNGVNIPFDIHNAKLNPSNGLIEELPPNQNNAFNMFYLLDGRGFNSDRTGFFLPFKQGNLSFQDEFFTNPEVLRTFDLPAENVNNNDFFVQQIDEIGNVVEDWTQVDTTFGESVSFNTFAGTLQSVYELDTLLNDQVRVKFGDGSFGRIPVGRFRFWYRTANPTPTPITPAAIQNQSLSLPYIDEDAVHQLTMTYSLDNTITNGVETESNFDIRTRAGKVFYTQNRMVNAQDYNNFYLKDNSIQKVKTVNRSFTGQSRYSRLTDPSGLYQNVKHLAEDGRLYQDETITVQTFSGDTNVLPVEALVTQHIRPLIRKEDKKILYFNKYTEIVLTQNYRWTETAIVADQSRGNVTLSAIPQIVGDTGTGVLQYIDTDAILRFNDPLGVTTTVNRVIEDGTAADGVVLNEVIDTDSRIYSVYPALRNQFSDDELIELEVRIFQKLDFALSWNQTTQTWDFINADNIDKTSRFSLDNQGNVDGNAQDASWMILFEFKPNCPLDIWTITDRGESLFFESAREVDFIFSNNALAIDPETGQTRVDNVKLLRCNEARDSLRRRGLDALSLGRCELGSYTFIGDAATKCFQTPVVPLDEERTVVLLEGVVQVLNVDYTIEPNFAGYKVCFTVAPPEQAFIEVYFSSRFITATQSVTRVVGDGVIDEYDLGVTDVEAANVISFVNGVIQNSSLDFGISDINGNGSIVYNEVLPLDIDAVAYVISNITNRVFTKTNYTGNNVTVDYTSPVPNLTDQTVLVSLDGVIQAPSCYTVTGTDSNSTIVFDNPPKNDVRIRLIAVNHANQTRSSQYEFAGNGVTNSFTMANDAVVRNTGEGLIVTIDGVLQDGPWAPTPCWSITGNNELFFVTPPPDGTIVQAFYIAATVGVDCEDDISSNFNTGTTGGSIVDNTDALDIESCIVHFLRDDLIFRPTGVIRHDDGYTNKNGLQISPNDANFDNTFDNPFIFKDFVIQDGRTDLVLWRRIQEFGFSVFDPINGGTSPRGTYDNSFNGGGIAAGDAIDTTITSVGDIHLDTNGYTWLVADAVSGTWIVAPDQSAYKYLIGRDDLKFIWTHYSPEANRIDPSKSNIMNVYILTTGYDTAYRSWLSQNGAAEDEPSGESSEQLRIQYEEFEEFKPISDAVIYYPARYKPLFGQQAIPELQATFKIIQTPGSQLSESDLKLRVLNAIDTYFGVDRWEFGEKFFFTELVAFVHAQMAPDLQSMVIVPTRNDQAFGRMFQVRSEPDELFISAASPSDIEIVQFFTDEEIRIGALA